MIQFIWIFLLFGSSYVSNADSELPLLTNVNDANAIGTKTTATTELAPDVTDELYLGNRNARDARLLEGETMGGLTNCESFEIGDGEKKEFYSPNYPKEYPSLITCTRIIEAPSTDEQVILDFRDQFDMEPSDNCKFDTLEIRDGRHGYSPMMDKYCGNQFPPQIKSSGPSLWLRFKSDENIEYKGFRAVYWFEKRKNISDEERNQQPCIVNKTEKAGDFTLSSNDIPLEYREKANRSGIDCLFRIKVEDQKLVSLSWDEFRLEHPNDCDLNYVHLLEENSDTIKQTFCGAAAEPILYESSEMQILYVVKKAAINSTFNAHFTPFRRGNCTDDEFNCQDQYCIDKSLQCNEVNNCLTASDEDTEECNKRKQESFWSQITKIDLLIILIVFFLILFGMCFTLIFNIVRKLIHDFNVIKEHVHQSRESQLDQLGRKTPTATLLTPLATVVPNLPDSLLNITEIRSSVNAQDCSHDEENDCYVPTENTFPNLIQRDCRFERMNGGPQYYHNACQTHRQSSRYNNGDEEEDGLVMQSSDCGYMPEMRDNECQTRESLFFNTSSTTDTTASKNASISPSPPPPCTIRRSHIKAANALPPVNSPTVNFVTFGKNQKSKNPKEHRFRAEAVIEVERCKLPIHDPSGIETKASSRPYSVQSTKSAPDVIVTH